MSYALPEPLPATLRAAQHIVVLCGSGVSAESGVPTFRDAQTGLWATFRPEELATPEAFERNPQIVWDWYAWRRRQCLEVAPNAGHMALARMARLTPRLTLITQNVDGLHQRAGSPEVLEFHGNIHVDRCFVENRALGPGDFDDGRPPTCRHCGAPVRPGVVWFGEAIDPGVLERAFAACGDCDVFIAAGTSAEVHPAAGLADIACRAGATLIEVNPDSTPITHMCDFSLREKSATVLPALCAAIETDGGRA